MSDCIINGCENSGVHNIGIRLRRPDATAIWAPNTGAMVCDFHASRGMRVFVYIEPTDDSKIETVVRSLGESFTRNTPITHTPEDK